MAFSYIKVETTLNSKKDKPTVYKIAQQTIPPVTFSQMVTDISEACGVNTTMSRALVEGLISPWNLGMPSKWAISARSSPYSR